MDFVKNNIVGIGLLSSIPVSWAISNTRNSTIRFIGSGLSSCVLLYLPTGFPFGSWNTMHKSILVGMSSIHLMSSAFFPKYGQSLFNHAKNFLYYFCPVSWTEPPREQKQWLIHTGKHFLIAIAKILVSPILYYYFSKLLVNYPENPSYIDQIKYSGLISLSMVSFGWFTDFLVGIVSLVSLGRLDFLEFNDDVLLSADFADFWGRRYNRLIRSFLHTYIFTPLRNLSYSPAFSSMMCFIVSGLLHTLVVHYAFGRGEVPSFLFFFY